MTTVSGPALNFFPGLSLRSSEKAVLALRSLYARYGYSCYKMSKFEEYDLYARNKDFLVSGGIITFTDVNGRLMALKPDVTLSIIRRENQEGSTGPGIVQKVYYDENVYRTSKRTHAFREIPQVGLECLGAVDDYSVSEVLTLAAESLRLIREQCGDEDGEDSGPGCVLDISHLGILSALVDSPAVPSAVRQNVIDCIAGKNPHGLLRVCRDANIPAEHFNLLKDLAAACGKPDDVLSRLKEIFDGPEHEAPRRCAAQLEHVLDALPSDLRGTVRVDFSVVNNLSYYNGIVFRGFIEGIPDGVLSGGQYDRLMRRMGRGDGAIGFAIYLDLLEQLDRNDKRTYDVDTLLLYDEEDAKDGLASLNRTVRRLAGEGRSVTAQRAVPENLKFRRVVRLRDLDGPVNRDRE